MSHPQSCKDPNCTLSYRDHLTSIAFSSDGMPTRSPETHQTNIRQKRWDADMDAFARLYNQGYSPSKIDGAAHREKYGETKWDVTDRPVQVDYTKPGGDSFGLPKEIKEPSEIF